MINIFVFLLAIMGFGISFYIFYNKRKHNKMVCHFGGDCNAVLDSKYNNTFGISNEVGGIIYYLVVALLVVLFMAGIVGFGSVGIYSTLIFLGAIAVAFSIYLTYVQGVILKNWCQYCLASAVINLLIFIVELLP